GRVSARLRPISTVRGRDVLDRVPAQGCPARTCAGLSVISDAHVGIKVPSPGPVRHLPVLAHALRAMTWRMRARTADASLAFIVTAFTQDDAESENCNGAGGRSAASQAAQA